MENDERHYGRKRTKKPKPVIETGKSQLDLSPSLDSEKQPEEQNSEVSVGEAKTVDIPEKVSERATAPRRAEKPTKPRPRPERPRGKKPPAPRDRKTERKPRGKPETRVSVIIPGYNEQDNVEPLLIQFDEVMRNHRDWEVIFVDDGSIDDTGRLVRRALPKYRWLRVVSHTNNKGLTAALDTGFERARGSIYVFYPADLQYHAEEIPKMIARIDRGADVVTGWKQGKYRKRLVSFVYNRICRMLFGIKVHDLNSVKAFKKQILDDITMRQDWHRFLVVLAAEGDFRIDEVKVTLYPRAHGKSKFGLGRILGGVLDLFSVKFQISFMKRPLRFFGTWGVISGAAGFIIGLIATYLRFFTDHGSRTLLYLVILLMLSGLGLFALGFLAEVMVGLREEINALKRKK
jgi:glycosyltransferase involved in cell wall biosynthesis